MHLVDVLAAGIVGAENGTATIYRRGTSMTITYYSDFEGTDPNSTGDDIDLDARGATVVYINEQVDVVVKDLNGVEVVRFTDAMSAPMSEYQGQSFTGVDYDTGASEVGSPVTVQTILNRWLDSAGAPDWLVDVGGVDTDLDEVINSFAGMFYNVKAPAYGAKGDAATDDTTAIQAAIDAADAAGGGIVFFPYGIYKTSSELSLPNNISLWGSGANASAILIDDNTEHLLTVEGSDAGFKYVQDMAFASNQANTGYFIEIPVGTSNAKVVFERCHFVSEDIAAPVACASNSSRLIFRDCFFEDFATIAVNNGSADSQFEFTSCLFETPTTFNGTSIVASQGVLRLTDCTFDCSDTTVGTYGIITAPIAAHCSITGCEFTDSGAPGTTVVAAIKITAASNNHHILESGNSFGDSVMAYSYSAIVTDTGVHNFSLGSRENRTQHVTDDNAAVTLEADQYGIIQLIRTDATAQEISANPAPQGCKLIVQIFNNGNLGAPTGNLNFNTDDFIEAEEGGTFTVDDEDIYVIAFVSMQTQVDGSAATVRWVQTGSSEDMAV